VIRALAGLAALAFALMATVSPIAGLAQSEVFTMTGERLLKLCTTTGPRPDAANEAYCLGYVSGAADGHSFHKEDALEPGWKSDEWALCMPEGLSPSSMKGIVVDYIANHVEIAHMRADDLVFVALRRSFPCSRSSPPP